MLSCRSVSRTTRSQLDVCIVGKRVHKTKQGTVVLGFILRCILPKRKVNCDVFLLFCSFTTEEKNNLLEVFGNNTNLTFLTFLYKISTGVCSFYRNCTEQQILSSLCSVDFHTLTLQLPIQTLHSVAPEHQIFFEFTQNFSKASTPLRCFKK